MSAAENYIEIHQLCRHYEIETSFIDDLSEYGLIEINTIDQSNFIHHDRLGDFERMVRLHHDLHINMEGIASVLHLLDKMAAMQSELDMLRNRLGLYEEG